jgi:hypothetical protein
MHRHTWDPCYVSFGLVMSTHYEPKTCITGPKDTSRQNQDVFGIIFFSTVESKEICENWPLTTLLMRTMPQVNSTCDDVAWKFSKMLCEV